MGMGIQINLLFEVGLIMFSNIVMNEGDGDDQGKCRLGTGQLAARVQNKMI